MTVGGLRVRARVEATGAGEMTLVDEVIELERPRLCSKRAIH